MNGKVEWIKLYVDIFANRKIMAFFSTKNGNAIFVTWIYLLCLAASTNDEGRIYLADKKNPYTNEMLADMSHQELPIIEEAIEVFTSYKMITREGGVLKIKNWSRYQNVKGLDEIRKQNRERQSRYRARKKKDEDSYDVMGNAMGNVTATSYSRYVTPLEIERNLDEEGDAESSHKGESINNALSKKGLTSNEENNHYGPYENVRLTQAQLKELQKMMSEQAVDYYINRLSTTLHDHPERNYNSHFNKIADFEREDRNTGKGFYSQNKSAKNSFGYEGERIYSREESEKIELAMRNRH